MFQHTLATALVAASLAMPAYAHHDGDSATAAGIVISHAHTIEVSETAHSIDVFVTIENTSDQAITLTAASVDFAAGGILQAPAIDDNGVMSVREISGLQIAPGQTLTMQPNGVHMVFHGVQQSFEAGEHFHADLTFDTAGVIEIEVEVEEGTHADHDHNS